MFAARRTPPGVRGRRGEHLNLVLDLEEGFGSAHGVGEEVPVYPDLALIDLVHVGSQFARGLFLRDNNHLCTTW
jgi:hypothetical protein